MINRVSKERIAELTRNALVMYALKENGIAGIEVIDGVCSWGIGVAPEFSWYPFEDDMKILADWAADYIHDQYHSYPRSDELDAYMNYKRYAMHLVPVWEYDGNDPSGGQDSDVDPAQYTFENLVEVFYRDYLNYCDVVDEIMLDKAQ